MSRDDDRLAGLNADYGTDWAIQYLPTANLPWEARRLPFRLRPSGGYTWLNAPTADRLGELIGGAMQVEAQLAAEDAARARLDALRMRAAAAGFRTEPVNGSLAVTAPPDDDGPGRSDTVSCHPRLDDEGQLWFFDGAGNPIVEADNVTDAVVHLGGALWRVHRDA